MADITDINDKKQKKDVQSEERGEKDNEKDVRIKQLEAKIKELDNSWRRALADYQNLQKRVSADRDDYVKYGSALILLKFLDVLDNLKEAAKHIKDKGLDLVINLYENVLKSEGVEEMERLGKEFDPEFDECVEKREGKDNNKIIEIVKNGYLLRGRVLRPSKVIVEVKK